MNLKEHLVSFRNKLTAIMTNNDFDELWKKHPIEEHNIYRLHYVEYYKIGEGYLDKPRIGRTQYMGKPFRFPKGMTREEGFRVLSYLTDFIEKDDNIEECSLKSMKTLDEVLSISRLGFVRSEEKDERKILNLFAVAGRVSYFEKSSLYQQYFEWYSEGVTTEEVSKIYAKCGIEFYDLVLSRKNAEQEEVKILKK